MKWKYTKVGHECAILPPMIIPGDGPNQFTQGEIDDFENMIMVFQDSEPLIMERSIMDGR